MQDPRFQAPAGSASSFFHLHRKRLDDDGPVRKAPSRDRMNGCGYSAVSNSICVVPGSARPLFESLVGPQLGIH